MRPKEKAQELIDKYRIILMQSDTDAGEEILCTTISKQCALLAVDEVLDFLDHPDWSYTFEYWQEVKKEIENL